MKKILLFSRKLIDIFGLCGKILSICKDYAETKQVEPSRSERGTVKALNG